MPIKKRVAIIGATGSVGSAVLDICARFPERFEVVALAANTNRSKLLELAGRFGVPNLCLSGVTLFSENGRRCLSGVRGLSQIVADDDVDHVVIASSGVTSAWALRDALNAGKEVSLSNKESLVAAGPWIMPLVKSSGQLRPIDSEHSALWQCLRGEPVKEVKKVLLTASGGPFKDVSAGELDTVSPEAALNHPVWGMGAKVTIDSATLMNKGIECVEAMYLFGLSCEQVDALVHPGSQAHAMVLFNDGTMKMLISRPDMRLPAAAALAYPERLDIMDSDLGFILPEEWTLGFSEIDRAKFPCFELAREAGRRGGAYPALLIGADETAVRAFLEHRIRFTDIHMIVSEVLSRWSGRAPSSLDEALELTADGARAAEEFCEKRRYCR